MRFYSVFHIIFVLFFLNASQLVFGQKDESASELKIRYIDSCIVANGYREAYISQLSDSKTPSSPHTSKVIYENRMEKMSGQSPVAFTYNADVQKYIDIYLGRRKTDFARMLGYSAFYFPIFEEYLDRYHLPLELKYLAVIESGLDPQAVSSSGAVGLWQFKYNTATMFGLKVTSYVDERCDVYKSTDAACRYLRYLYSIFNDWHLALAAYNGGPGEVRNAIIRSGNKTRLEDIFKYLPEQTRWYVPAYMAASYVMLYAGEHGIVAQKTPFSLTKIDTVMVHNAIDLTELSRILGESKAKVLYLNPMYRRAYIPQTGAAYPLVLPAEKIRLFLKKENKIYTTRAPKSDFFDLLAASGDTVGRTRHVYVVKQGDFLHKIAFNFRCTTDNLRAWNKLSSDQLRVGQSLVIWTFPEMMTSVNDSIESNSK
jgi:membrane-bound lytic murein transglycosylase D